MHDAHRRTPPSTRAAAQSCPCPGTARRSTEAAAAAAETPAERWRETRPRSSMCSWVDCELEPPWVRSGTRDGRHGLQLQLHGLIHFGELLVQLIGAQGEAIG